MLHVEVNSPVMQSLALDSELDFKLSLRQTPDWKWKGVEHHFPSPLSFSPGLPPADCESLAMAVGPVGVEMDASSTGAADQGAIKI